MRRKPVLIVGGGVTGLAAAGFLAGDFDPILVEKETEIGGYCRTIYQDGFTWDYSGHFFHFRNPWIAERLHSRMDSRQLLRIKRSCSVYFRGGHIDYPFQFNIHQLSRSDFVRCLADMNSAANVRREEFASFQDMLYGRYGRHLSELFFIPYNRKLYSVPLHRLDANSMGRFFPHIDFGELLARMAEAVNGNAADAGYNSNFSYHRCGAKAYVDALASYVPEHVVRVNATCERIDLARHIATVNGEEFAYDRLIITSPLPRVLELAGQPAPQGLLTANKVLVFNLGFDCASRRSDHWVYFPEEKWVFFRVGHYDNILGEKRMSLYVEIAMASDVTPDVDSMLERVLAQLEEANVTQSHKLVSHSHVLLDPAYVHVTTAGQHFACESIAQLNAQDVYPIGRYGRWTYCSIEEGILDAYSLARSWGAAGDIGPAEVEIS